MHFSVVNINSRNWRGFDYDPYKRRRPATIAPTTTSPGLKNETVPDWSTPARSKGAANQAEAEAGVVLPDGLRYSPELYLLADSDV